MAESKAKKKFLQSFKDDYTSRFPCISSSNKGKHYAFCRVCRCDLKIAHGGAGDISIHLRSKKHIEKEVAEEKAKNIPKEGRINTFFRKEDYSVINAEVMFTDFLVEHNIPLAAADHSGQLFRRMFPDSRIAKQYNCARTKASHVVQSLAAADRDTLVSQMKNSRFSLATDASTDMEAIKLYPLVIKTFDEMEGKVLCQLLSLKESSERSTGENIFGILDHELKTHNISWTNCVSLSSDNASVMLGKHKGVAAYAKEQNANIFIAGCSCHLIHLAAQKGSQKLKFPLDDLLVDVFYYIDKSSLRHQAIIRLQKEHGVATKKILKHVSTRWLSLGKVLDRLLENWSPLLEFFKDEATPNESRKRKASAAANGKQAKKVKMTNTKPVSAESMCMARKQPALASTSKSTAASTSTSKSTAASTSTSKSTAASTSTSKSTAASTSTSKRTAASTSTSKSTAASTSTSKSTAASTSTSKSTAASTSTSKRTAASTSTSKSTAASTSTSKSTAASTSTSKSTAASTSTSKRTAASTSTSKSTAASTSTSKSTAASTSTSKSTAASTSTSKSTAASTSTSKSTAASTSTSKSTAASTSTSKSTAASTSTSKRTTTQFDITQYLFRQQELAEKHSKSKTSTNVSSDTSVKTSSQNDSLQGKAARIFQQLNDPNCKLQALFLQACLPAFDGANTMYNLDVADCISGALMVLQSDEPYIHRIHRILLDQLASLLSKFVKPSAIVAAEDITKLDLANEDNHKDNEDIHIGFECRQFLKDNEDKLDVATFYTSAKNFLSASSSYMIQKYAFNDDLLLNAEVLDISARLHKKFSSVEYFIKRFNLLPLDKMDKVESEFLSYQIDKDIVNIDIEDGRIDEKWHKIGQLRDFSTNCPKYALLTSVMKCILVVFHSNSDCERIFSIVEKNKTKQRASLGTPTLGALLIHKLAVQSRGKKCFSSEYSPETLKAAKSATYQALSGQSTPL
ncbi:uncharacterized protein LOC105438204 [Strongylocentrotus purpuratus]|uniref:HAT C-terminal dimerisation domain-containing protein n=1 Tax=Strongylocentrotus purpuratus TaxID=7668 RepID=A0A7M7LVP1_STRPU|nr:uncharacterized protein LOC105438204 [Strongylocentrotus purpuratus]